MLGCITGSFGSPSQSMQFGQPNMFGYQNPFMYPQFGAQQFGGSHLVSPQQFGGTQLMPQQFQFMPQPFGSQQFGSFRGFSRGRSRGPRLPCEICGRSNHSTNWCHYRSPQLNYFSQMSSSVPWGGANTSGQWGNTSGIPMFQPSQRMPQVSSSSTPTPMSQSTGSAQAHFAAMTNDFSAMKIAPSSSTSHGSSQYAPLPSTVVHMGTSSSMPPPTHFQASITTPQAQPWYFDSGATNHITNNLQHVINPQPASVTDGVRVGNGTNLQVSHTGQGLLPTPSGPFLLSHVLHTP